MSKDVSSVGLGVGWEGAGEEGDATPRGVAGAETLAVHAASTSARLPFPAKRFHERPIRMSPPSLGPKESRRILFAKLGQAAERTRLATAGQRALGGPARVHGVEACESLFDRFSAMMDAP
jgi:hypothetical protein